MESVLNESLSLDSLTTLYTIAHGYYQEGQYVKAEDCFRFLTLQTPTEKKNWLGIAACFQMQHEYQKALEAYAFAASLDEQDPLPHLHAAECFFHSNDAEASEIACQEADKRTENLQSRERVALKARVEWIRMACQNLPKVDLAKVRRA